MPYIETYTLSIEGGGRRTVKIQFKDEETSEHSEVDMYDEVYVPAQKWLDKHYPGEKLASDGYDIERSGYPADNDDMIIIE